MNAKTYIPPLTGIRAIAAFMVFFHHANQLDYPRPIFRIFNEFHTGVAIFFVLSGFLIALRYYENCEISSNWYRRYIKNRIARIYPMYFLITVATFAVAYWLNDNTVYNNFPYHLLLIILNIFFIRGLFDDLKFTGLSQGWTLTVEECFYFLAPFFFIKIKKNKNNLWKIPGVLLLTGIILVLIFRNLSFYGFYGNFTFMFLYTFTGRCIEFFIGIAVARICLLHSEKIKKFALPVYTIGGFLLACTAIGIMASLPLSKEHPYGQYHPMGIISNNIILPCGVALLFYGLINEPSLFKKFLSTPTMQLLGKSSYIFYLVHIGFIAHASNSWAQGEIDKLYNWLYDKGWDWFPDNINGNIISTAIVFIILNIVSIVLYKLIEHPVNEWIRKSSFLEGKKAV